MSISPSRRPSRRTRCARPRARRRTGGSRPCHRGRPSAAPRSPCVHGTDQGPARPARVRRYSGQVRAASESPVAPAPVPRAPGAGPDGPRTGAFFDVDNTIIRGASAFHLAKGLYLRGFFRKRDLLRFGLHQLRYLTFGENKKQIDEVRQRALEIMTGHSVAEVTAIAEDVYDEVLLLRIYPGTQRLLDEHIAAGHSVWLVTATPREIGEIIARRLGATGALGTVAEHKDGYYTGRLVGDMLHGRAKAEAVRAIAASPRDRPRAVLRLRRLHQRRADPVRGRLPVRDQPRPTSAQARRRGRLARPRVPHPPSQHAPRHRRRQPGRPGLGVRPRRAHRRPVLARVPRRMIARPVLVRPAVPADVPALAALAALTFPLACPPGSTPAGPAGVHRRGALAGAVHVVPGVAGPVGARRRRGRRARRLHDAGPHRAHRPGRRRRH